MLWHPIMIIVFMFFITINNSWGSNYYIFAIDQDLPLKNDVPYPPKTYYLNMGQVHGISVGQKVSVYRNIIKNNTLENNRRYNFKLEIAILEITHVEFNSSIAKKVKSLEPLKKKLLPISGLMIGDTVEVKIPALL